MVSPGAFMRLLLTAKLQGFCSLVPSSLRHKLHLHFYRASQMALVIKNPPANSGDVRNVGSIPGFDPWVGKIPWRRAWQPIPVLLPGESPWMEETGGLQSMGSQRAGHD